MHMFIWYVHFFYCIFAQFMQFPVLHFGLDHYASQPFNYQYINIIIMLWIMVSYTQMASMYRSQV